MTGPEDNPFAVLPPRQLPWKGLLRTLALVSACLLVVYGLHVASQIWLLDRLTADLADHAPSVQRERLQMVAELGVRGVPALVETMTSSNEELAVAGYDQLRNLRGRWATGAMDASRANGVLVRQLDARLAEFPSHREAWVVDLLEQVMVETVESPRSDNADTYRLASRLMNLVSQRDADPPARLARPELAMRLDSGSMDLSGTPAAELLPTRLAAAQGNEDPALTPPLPQWSGSHGLGDPADGFGLEPPIGRLDSDDSTGTPATDLSGEGGEAERDANPLRGDADAATGAAELLRVEPDGIATAGATIDEIGASPLSAYDTRSVIDFVDSVRANLRAAAIRELRGRGFTDGDMEMATRMVSTDVRVRLSMIDDLLNRVDVDPRQWLLWLAEDAERDVRLRAVSVLGTMDDPAVTTALRRLLRDERDPTVASRLRSFLR